MAPTSKTSLDRAIFLAKAAAPTSTPKEFDARGASRSSESAGLVSVPSQRQSRLGQRQRRSPLPKEIIITMTMATGMKHHKHRRRPRPIAKRVGKEIVMTMAIAMQMEHQKQRQRLRPTSARAIHEMTMLMMMVARTVCRRSGFASTENRPPGSSVSCWTT